MSIILREIEVRAQTAKVLVPLTCTCQRTDMNMSNECLDDMKRCQIRLYSALYCRFAFLNLYCG